MADDAELRRMAIHRADMKLGFRAHVMAYAIVNAGLTLINLVTTPDHIWFYWPMIGWGLGLAAHAAAVFADGEHIRDRMIEAEYERLRRRTSGS
ncbi:MAG TPA: 2TM domain-containing protein [Phenylobacterium sp.]|nr:2TM domain-containing protein [Phenylobacterium sp.]